MALKPAPWGADIGTVAAHIPSVPFTEDTKPSTDNVEQWVEDFAAEVGLHLIGYAALTPWPAVTGQLEEFAGRLVALGAAARTANAAYLESTSRSDSPYAYIRAEYESGLKLLDTLLAKLLGNLAATGDPNVAPPPVSGAGASPARPRASAPSVRVPDGSRYYW